MIAERILDSRRAHRARGQLEAADRALGRAERAMEDHDYAETWEKARDAYEHVLRGADRADVDVEASFNGWSVLPSEGESSGGRNSVVAYGGFDKIGAGTRRSMP